LAGIDQNELGRFAGELGMASKDLEELVARGPDAANLLYQRMQALGLSRANVEPAAHGLMRDLERTCACCHEKGSCEKDLHKQPQDCGWKSYCPNAITLESLTRLKGYFPA
jgi:hypothetical protein